MAVTKAKKADVLKKLEEKFSRAKAVYFSDYRGMPVKKLGTLRKKLREAGVDYVVAKKTLYKIALKKNNLPEVPDDILAGPVGAAIGYDDVVVPVKVLNDYTKEAEQLQILGGIAEGKLLSKAMAKELANLPSKEQLLAKLVGSLKSPLYGLHGVLSGVMRKFVYAMAAVRDKKQA
ncbi:MAG TPA: 50S ribosomal protein L10 [Candidatus Gracilibacteria bacterium]|nr:50S ribosomal protein L10 [Candidatus Gracilibacteria bacterium]HRY90802.1 50S ribosomal protein L10 [Candidatus Gracilibacteria bacterium]